MPKYVQADKAYNYQVSFEVGGELVSPTSALITLQDNSGQIVEAIENDPIVVATDATSAVYTIPAEANAKTLTYDLRYVTISFQYNGATYTIRDFYAIQDNVLIPVTPDDVRNVVGMTSEELPDERIDIPQAMALVQADVDVDLATQFNTGSVLVPYAQRAIALRAAMDSCMFIENMIYASEQADNTLYKRFETDLDAIQQKLADAYAAAINALNGVDPLTAQAVTFFTAVTGTDPVTGS